MAQIHINIGSNVNKQHNINAALKQLKSQFGKITTSSLYQSPAEGFIGDDFYNIGVNIQTNLSIDKVSNILNTIEQTLGRNRENPKFSNRVIDLDLVLYDSIISEQDNLPRDDILKYAFVLVPLIELNPNQIHPTKQVPFKILWSLNQYGLEIEIV